MKTQKIALGALAFMAFCTNSLLADGWGEYRSTTSCDRQYSAYAEVKCNFIQGWVGGRTTVCYPYCAEKNVEKRNLSNTLLVSQKTKYGPFCGFSSTGEVKRKRCYRGCSMFDYVNHYNSTKSTNEDEGPDASESHSITSSGVTVNTGNRTVIISDISGYERINTTDFWGRFRIVIWESDSETDTVLTSGKIRYEAYVTLENGQITYSNFGTNEVTLINTDTGYVMLFGGFSDTVTLGSTVNMDRVVVRLETHAEESLSSSIALSLEETAANISANNIVLNVAPNPSKDIIVLNYSLDEADRTLNNSGINRIVLRVFNSVGAEITPLAETFGSAKIEEYRMDISILPSGVYYVTLHDGKHFSTVKIIKE